MLTEGCRNANDQAFALEFFGQVDLVPGRILHETFEVWDRVANHDSGGGSGVEGGTWTRPDGRSRRWHKPAQRSCSVHGVNNGVRYSVHGGKALSKGILRFRELPSSQGCSVFPESGWMADEIRKGVVTCKALWV